MSQERCQKRQQWADDAFEDDEYAADRPSQQAVAQIQRGAIVEECFFAKRQAYSEGTHVQAQLPKASEVTSS